MTQRLIRDLTCSLSRTRKRQIRLLPEAVRVFELGICSLQFALTTPQGCMKTIHQFVIGKTIRIMSAVCTLSPLPSPVICALAHLSLSCPAARHGADPFIVKNLVGLASHSDEGISVSGLA
jgi:hypothetical protein